MEIGYERRFMLPTERPSGGAASPATAAADAASGEECECNNA